MIFFSIRCISREFSFLIKFLDSTWNMNVLPQGTWWLVLFWAIVWIFTCRVSTNVHILRFLWEKKHWIVAGTIASLFAFFKKILCPHKDKWINASKQGALKLKKPELFSGMQIFECILSELDLLLFSLSFLWILKFICRLWSLKNIRVDLEAADTILFLTFLIQ